MGGRHLSVSRYIVVLVILTKNPGAMRTGRWISTFEQCLDVVSETPLGRSDTLSIPNPYILSSKIFYERRNEDFTTKYLNSTVLV